MTKALLEPGPAVVGSSPVFAARLLLALAQAVLLYVLADAEAGPRSWPATRPFLFSPLILVSVFIPLLAMLETGRMAARSLVAWVVCLVLVLAGLGLHDVWRGGSPPSEPWPSWRLWMGAGIGLFLANALVPSALAERRFRPSYKRFFDALWTRGAQLVLSALFVLVFWCVLHLGAALFNLIGIRAFRDLLTNSWFYFPATTVSFAVSIHVTNVHVALIASLRRVALALFSWLLPLVAAIVLVFLACLPFVSVAALWKTHFALFLLLTTSILLVLFINGVYQDGALEQAPSGIKKIAGTVGALELVPLTGLAVWALTLRVGQHGWSEDRVLAAAILAVMGGLAIGYALAALVSRPWMKGIETVNVAAAMAALVGLLALFSPVADPARLMVADQMARLKSGAVSPDRFDLATLKAEGARWGAEALATLAADPGAILLHARIDAMTNRNRAADGPPEMRIRVYPEGRSLPDGFRERLVQRASQEGVRPRCGHLDRTDCVVRLVTLQPGAAEDVLLVDGGSASLWSAGSDGQWEEVARLNGPMACGGVKEALAAGPLAFAPHPWPDVRIGDQILTMVPVARRCD